jgi:Phosphoglycerate dehydrogenase and related dehydrogenases
MSEKKKILIIQKVHQKGMELIKNHPNFEVDVTDDISEENLKAKIQNCDGASIRIANLSGEVMKEAKNLKIVSRHGVGYDNIDLNYAKEKNIKIAITANANAVTVSEHVMFNLLNISKRKDLFDKTVREGNFKDRNKLPKTIELWKKNFLIAGFGRIGQALIKRCLGFEMNVYVFDPFISKEKIELMGGKKIENFEEAVKSMDVISLHMPLTEKTKNLINYELLKTMKKNCIIINAARGGIINEIDLDKALNENLIFGAGIKGFEKEPPDNNNPL